jgi:ubiquinone/menaquinone biosynthesis C-methylase UbiE
MEHDVGASSRTPPPPSSVWALGDYHRFAKATLWKVGPVLVEACGIGAGQRVLDVGAGTGNVAIRAAERGARVIASDITPENFAAGRREAAAQGVEVEWRLADAQGLPFGNGEFDVVTSAFGAIFAPDHQAVADELVRVCRPGGVIGMTNLTPDGLGAEFFAVFAPYSPAPPEQSPTDWGDERHVRELFRGRVRLELTRRTFTERAEDPEAYSELYLTSFGPAVGVRAALAEEPERAAAFERDLLDFARRANTGPEVGPAEYQYEYLLVVGRTG